MIMAKCLQTQPIMNSWLFIKRDANIKCIINPDGEKYTEPEKRHVASSESFSVSVSLNISVLYYSRKKNCPSGDQYKSLPADSRKEKRHNHLITLDGCFTFTLPLSKSFLLSDISILAGAFGRSDKTCRPLFSWRRMSRFTDVLVVFFNSRM